MSRPSSSSDPLAERVLAVMAATLELDRAHLTTETTFADLDLDSVDGLDLFFALEDELDVDLPDDEARAIRGVGELIESLRPLVAAKQSGSDSRA